MLMTAEEHHLKSKRTLEVIHRMEAALAANANNMQDYFHDQFVWHGNVGCGTKKGLSEFRKNWQLPLRAAFTERVYRTERFLADGDWAACYGHIEATHSGLFMGVAPTGLRVRIPYTDFWLVQDERIVDNHVNVDFAKVLQQLGVEVFRGQGWESYDEGRIQPPAPPSN